MSATAIQRKAICRQRGERWEVVWEGQQLAVADSQRDAIRDALQCWSRSDRRHESLMIVGEPEEQAAK